MIEDFQHVCITCRNIERSIDFYQRIGLTIIEPIRELDEDALARAMQLPKGHIKVAHLGLPDATSKLFIDLVQWLEPASTGKPYAKLNQIGINRLAFRVSEIDKTMALLREQGITFLTQEPQSFKPIRTVVMTDPDGVFIQFLEWL